MFNVCKNGQYWKDVLYHIVLFLASVITWSITVTWWAVSFNGISYWFWERFLPSENIGLAELLNLPISDSLLYLIIGIITIITLPVVTHGLMKIHVAIARGLLSSKKK